ncbi:MAG: PEP-CTERM sorting domain-containing protein, partial [Phycisphaerae bacterium]
PLGVVSNPWQYPSGAIGGGIVPRDGNGNGNGGPIPIIPVIPEPATVSLMGAALAMMALRCWRRRR